MNIEKTMDKIINTTIKDLIDGKYKLIEIGAFESILKYRGNELKVWIANGESYCKINALSGLKFPEFDDETKAKIFKMATAKTPYMIKESLKRARKVQRESYLKYKENVSKVKILREELKSFKV